MKPKNTQVKIIIDTKTSISNVLSIWPNTELHILPGCGFILRNASNSAVLQNKNKVNPVSPYDNSNIVDKNILITGFGILNGNGYNTGAGGSDVFDVANNGSPTNGSAQTKRNAILDFCGVENFEFSGQLLGGRYWAGTFCNMYKSRFPNVFIDFGESSTRDDYNYDGLHFKGGVNVVNGGFCHVKNAKDDNMAFNSYSQLPIYTDQRGPIDNIVWDHVHIESRTMGVGIYSEVSPSLIGSIIINKLTGTTQSHAVRITNGETVSPDGDGIKKIRGIWTH